jgi:hypothetical protein
MFKVIHPVVEAILEGGGGDVAQKQSVHLTGLLRDHLGGMSGLEGAVHMGKSIHVGKARSDVVNVTKLKAASNLTASGHAGIAKQSGGTKRVLAKLQRELDLAVCDVPCLPALQSAMRDAWGKGGAKLHIRGAGAESVSRSRAVAFEATMTSLVNNK